MKSKRKEKDILSQHSLKHFAITGHGLLTNFWSLKIPNLVTIREENIALQEKRINICYSWKRKHYCTEKY